MTQPGIELRSSGLLANTVPMGKYIYNSGQIYKTTLKNEEKDIVYKF